MKQKYKAWIENWLTVHGVSEGGGYGLCHEASKDMAEAFPELLLVRGHVYCLEWGKRGHWWCTEVDGTTVDPTAKQFPSIMRYEKYTPGDSVRLGKCMNCGSEIWGPDLESVYSPILCSEECGKDYEDYCSQPWG